MANSPFPSSPGPLYLNEVKCSTFDMEMFFILTQLKLIFTRKVLHLTSLSLPKTFLAIRDVTVTYRLKGTLLLFVVVLWSLRIGVVDGLG